MDVEKQWLMMENLKLFNEKVLPKLLEAAAKQAKQRFEVKRALEKKFNKGGKQGARPPNETSLDIDQMLSTSDLYIKAMEEALR